MIKPINSILPYIINLITEIKVEEFKEKAKYFYNPKTNTLNEIDQLSIRYTQGYAHIWVCDINYMGISYKCNYRKPAFDGTASYSLFTQHNAGQACYIYESKENFVKDLVNSNQRDIDILDRYEAQYIKKKEQMKDVMDLIKVLKEEIPELFI